MSTHPQSARRPVDPLYAHSTGAYIPEGGGRLWSANTKWDAFARRPKVQTQCSTGCLDLHQKFEEQKVREVGSNDSRERYMKEKSAAYKRINFDQMPPKEKASTLLQSVERNLDRTENLFGGFLRKINEDLDSAEQYISESEGEVGNLAAYLDLLRTRENAINWATQRDLLSLVNMLMERDAVYSEILASLGVADPFGGVSALQEVQAGSALDNVLSEYWKHGQKLRFPLKTRVSKIQPPPFYTQQ